MTLRALLIGALAMTLAAAAASPSAAASGPMLDALGAAGPDPRHADKLMQFGRFVGTWDLDVVYYDEQGKVRRRTPGEWTFGWALEGRAIADVWIVPPRSQRPTDGPPPGEYGVTLRFYDPGIDAWRSTWHGPVNGVVMPFTAREMDGEMVLERTEDDGALSRWIFGEIRPESFHWRAVRSSDGGRTWRLEQEMFATRRP